LKPTLAAKHRLTINYANLVKIIHYSMVVLVYHFQLIACELALSRFLLVRSVLFTRSSIVAV